MPNHVQQRLTVAGTPGDIEAFVATARGAGPATGDGPDSCNKHESLCLIALSFHMIAPLPDEYSMHPYGDRGSVGIELERKLWGTKWGPYDISEDSPRIAEDKSTATYDFTCAWGPPVEALRRASLRYPTLRFFLSWGGEGPCRGRHMFDRGKTTFARSDNYERDIKPDMPSDEEYEKDEDSAYERGKVAERKYIDSHDVWVEEEIRTSKASR